MMAAKQINYAAIFGPYVMKTQFEIVKEKEAEKKSESNRGNKAIMQETIEDYIEQA